MKLSQKGVVHLLLLLILLGGLAVGVYLASSGNPLKLFSKASETKTQSIMINSLTSQLVQANSGYKSTKPGGKVQSQQVQQQAINKMVNIAARRKTELLKEIEKDPQAFLRDAKLASQRNNFPKEVQNYIENKVDNTEVTLSVVHFDDFKNAKSEEEYFVQKARNGSKQKAFFTKPPKLLSGTVLKISGIELDNKIAIESNDANLKPLNQVRPLQVATTNIAVILVKFENDTTDPFNRDDANRQVFGAPDSVKNYYKEVSYNQLNIAGDVLGWYKIPYTRTSNMPCYLDSVESWQDAAMQVARKEGVNSSNYSHLVYYFPGINCRSWAMLYGNKVTLFDFSKSVIIHELGHNFGARHANSLTCNGAQIDSYQKCTEKEYGDPYSIMGYRIYPFMPYFNAPYGIGFDWIPEGNRMRIEADGVYKITSALESSLMGTKSLIITKVQNAEGEYDGQSYYLEYRQPMGFDNNVIALCDSRGVQIRIWRGSIWSFDNTKLVDLTPSTPNNFSDASLSDGGMFYDPINKILIKQLSHDSTSVTVEVKFNATLPNGVTQNNINPQCSIASCESADLNRDGVVDSKDADVLQPCINKPPADNCTVADINQDGVINISDFSILASQQGNTCPRSTPTSTPVPSPFVCNTCNADIDKNGNIDITDFSLLSGCFEKQASEFDINGHSCVNPDLNKDGVVNQADFGCLKSQYGKQCKATPIPTTTSVNNQNI